MKAVKAQEISVTMENKVGALAQLSGDLSLAGINIRAITASVLSGKAFFRLITSDNEKTRETLRNGNYSFEENE